MSEADPTRAKQVLRAQLKARRGAVGAEERARASRRVAEKLIARTDWASIDALHVYLSAPAWGEIDTEPIIAFTRAHWPGIEVVSPTLAADQPPPRGSFDLIIVPVLGFDDSNTRLGLGAGFYDRFLAGQPHAAKVGLAYAWARVPEGIPHEPHDVPLDAIVTDA